MSDDVALVMVGSIDVVLILYLACCDTRREPIGKYEHQPSLQAQRGQLGDNDSRQIVTFVPFHIL
jgi:hypothetical protein